ncbi:hypothetical protein K7432_003184 [Basidiobolus ranarum]|uniref:Uncharacterized protein n=1 Tax=Basidiobolus ranarum TaxID=34480 RepID=A0ABR2X0D9_9FUNG
MNTVATNLQHDSSVKNSESLTDYFTHKVQFSSGPNTSIPDLMDETLSNLSDKADSVVSLSSEPDVIVPDTEKLTILDKEAFHIPLASITEEQVESIDDNNPLFYWDVSPVPNTPAFYKEIRQINIEDMPAYTPYTATPGTALGNNSQSDYFTAKVLAEENEVPTKLQGLRDKWRGSIKNQLGHMFRSEKLKQEGQYLMALGHQKLQFAKSQDTNE